MTRQNKSSILYLTNLSRLDNSVTSVQKKVFSQLQRIKCQEEIVFLLSVFHHPAKRIRLKITVNQLLGIIY